MPDVPIALVPWFDAKDNPPKEKARVYQTDLGLLYLRGTSDRPEWCEYLEGEVTLMKPSVYCEDPSPPDMSDPLTVEDLRGLDDAFNALIADNDEHIAAYGPMLARLRRALDAIGDSRA